MCDIQGDPRWVRVNMQNGSSLHACCISPWLLQSLGQACCSCLGRKLPLPSFLLASYVCRNLWGILLSQWCPWLGKSVQWLFLMIDAHPLRSPCGTLSLSPLAAHPSFAEGSRPLVVVEWKGGRKLKMKACLVEKQRQDSNGKTVSSRREAALSLEVPGER